ncbi:MAG: hypothetical protein LBF93_07625 [Zoogloeaceae bacterium]|jgi:predicted  nucleic acid-binding Zn ribbon protein|nr:hypothetical protein [Zoogloeaceae bacterium]
MTHLERSGWGSCALCGERIAVKKNRSGLAYYKCDGCGVTVQHNWRRESDAYLKKHGVGMEKREESQQQEPAAKPAAKRGGLSDIFGD